MKAPKNTDLIFVYGTLISYAQNPIAKVLANNAIFMGKAFYPGRLFRVKDYPGAVPSDVPKDKVHGEIFLLSNKKKLLPILDRYEAFGPNFPKPTEFIRKIQKVYFRDGRAVSVWIYIYNFSTQGLELIESGNYLSGLCHNTVNRPIPFYRNRINHFRKKYAEQYDHNHPTCQQSRCYGP